MARRYSPYKKSQLKYCLTAGLEAGVITPISGLTPSSTDYFRYVAVGAKGSTIGTPASATTLTPLPGVAEAPLFSNISVTTLTKIMIFGDGG